MATREDITRAVDEGAEAERRGDPPTLCPYSRASLLRGAWVRGYARTHPLTLTKDNE